MFTWRDVLIAEEIRADALHRAEHARWVQSMLFAKDRKPRFYHGLMVRFGEWMEAVGRRLKQRYSVVVDPPLASNVQKNKGCIL